MTKRTTPPKQNLGFLKGLLLTGSVIATLAGARLLPAQEPVPSEIAGIPDQSISSSSQTADLAAITLPPNGRRGQIELNSIPQAVQPQFRVVTRSRSSR